jgi:protein tyrosine phosphatase (PTP) superfamily phosphohydrolase (DUF442 family)
VTRTRLRRWIIRPLAVSALLLAIFIGWRYSTGNRGTVIAGRVYRSAQLGPALLDGVLRERGIRTVVNLRGSNPDQAWYRDERAATLAAGATQVDVPLASDLWLSRAQARMLVELIDESEPPLLVHCEWGAERTGLVCAFVELLRPGGSVESALGQFSAWYLFAPVRDGLRMRGHVVAYRDWLRTRRLAHHPDLFRRWVRQEYRPAHPSREDWPYDPYPLKVVTRPAAQVAGKPATRR